MARPSTNVIYVHWADPTATDVPDNRPLYVGKSSHGLARTRQHAAGAPWFHRVRRIEIIHLPVGATTPAVLAEERRLIKELRPLCNRKHNPTHDAWFLARCRAEQAERLRRRPSISDRLLLSLVPAQIYTAVTSAARNLVPGLAGALVGAIGVVVFGTDIASAFGI